MYSGKVGVGLSREKKDAIDGLEMGSRISPISTDRGRSAFNVAWESRLIFQ